MGKGDAEFEMGRGCFYGKGSLARSYAETVKHFRAACYDKPREAQGQPSFLPKAYNLPDCYSKAINYLIKAKEHGKIQDDDYNKFHNVAIDIYLNGIWGHRDITQDEYIQYFRLLSDEGHIESLIELGLCYLYGNGVFMDFDKAKMYFQQVYNNSSATQTVKSIAQEKIDAIDIGDMPQSYEQAIKYYRMAAEQGHAGAQIELGLCHLYGEGVPENKNEAVKWFLRAYNNPKATQENTKTAQEQLVKLGQLPDESAESLFKRGLNCLNSQLPLAIECLYQSASQGYAEAQLHLGLCYKDGTGVPRCILEAEKWLKMASENPDALAEITEDAQEQLNKLKSIPIEKGTAEFEKGQCHYYGRKGFEQSYEKAIQYYRMAAEQGHAGAQIELGLCHLYGEGVPENKNEAVKWFLQAYNNPRTTDEIKAKAQEYLSTRHR